MTLSSIAPLQSIQQTTALNPASGTANKTHQHSETARQGNDDTATFSAQGRRYAEQNLESQSSEPRFTYSENGSSKGNSASNQMNEDDDWSWMRPFFPVFDAKIGERIGAGESEWDRNRHLSDSYTELSQKMLGYRDEAIENLGYKTLESRHGITREDHSKIEEITKEKLSNDPEAVQLMNKLGIDI